jgi:hypothetical protein
MRKCAVELTGKNSVNPSIMPKMMDWIYTFKEPPESSCGGFRCDALRHLGARASFDDKALEREELEGGVTAAAFSADWEYL